jgi:hypothetical protein
MYVQSIHFNPGATVVTSVSPQYFPPQPGPSAPSHLESDQVHYSVLFTLTLVAFALRFYKISHPDQVV